eukprot:jgi/Mesvir1/9403/Mv01507-RA.1
METLDLCQLSHVTRTEEHAFPGGLDVMQTSAAALGKKIRGKFAIGFPPLFLPPRNPLETINQQYIIEEGSYAEFFVLRNRSSCQDPPMATLVDLKDALRETLENKGVLRAVKAKIRAEIFNSLDDRQDRPRPELSNENLIINELIREYLVYNQYLDTLSVLIPESGQPEVPPFQRAFLARELNILEDKNSKEIPLLYSLIGDAGGSSSKALS